MKADRVISGVAAALVLVGMTLAVLAGWGSVSWWALPALAVASAVTVRTSVRMSVAQQGALFALNDAVMAVAFLIAPGAWIAVAMPLGYLAATLGKSRPVKLAFNSALQFFATAAGVLVMNLAGNGVGGAVAGLALFAVLNYLVIAIPITVTSAVPVSYPRVLVTMGPLGLVHTAGNASVGLLAGWLAINAPLGLFGLIVPVGMLWWSYQQQTRRTSEAQLFAELAQGQERLGGSIDASAQVITTAAARLFGAEQVELLLLTPDGLIRYSGDFSGVSARLRVDADAMDSPWVLRALAARSVLTGQDGPRPYCSALLGDPERPLGVLLAHRPAQAGTFTRAEIQLAQVLVSQAESWLSVAELSAKRDEALGRAEAYGAANRVLGDMSQETVPALSVLRESAHRLSRLATRFEGPDAVDEIVAELYSVERAVASLLGAIALASDTEPDRPVLTAGPAATARPEAEWTTTGRLEDAVGP